MIETVDGQLGVAVITRNRRESLLHTLQHLFELPEQPRVVVVDNGSSDGTLDALNAKWPTLEVVSLSENIGSAARNVGVSTLGTPYVAFCDDDTWWGGGSLAMATRILDEYQQVALLTGRVLVGSEERLDPTCAAMKSSPLHGAGLPGPRILGFLAGASVVRAAAFVSVGGFDVNSGIGGEEALVALRLANSGWDLLYIEALTVHHHPSSARDPVMRRRNEIRNELITAWTCRPVPHALARTLRLGPLALFDGTAREALMQSVRKLVPVLRERRGINRDLRREISALK